MLHYPYNELPRHFIDALGVRTGYYTAGQPNGRPVVLLHGMSTSADSFRETMHELADNHWLIAPDFPGFGHSEYTEPFTFPHLVEWLASFQEALGLKRMVLVGHSFGGVVATTFALSYPEDVTRLLLLAPAILTSTVYPHILKRIGVSLGLIELGSKISQSPFMVERQIRVPFFDPDSQDESVWERRLNDYALARASAAVMKASAFHDLRPMLPQIEHPVCMVWGEDDAVVPHSDADILADLVPNTEVHKLSRCGHLPMLERSQEFLQITREFLS